MIFKVFGYFLYIHKNKYVCMKEEILNLYKKGYSYKEIKEMLGCSKSTISYHVNRYVKLNCSDLDKKILYDRKKERLTKPQLYEKYKNKKTKNEIDILIRHNNLSHLDRLDDTQKEDIQKEYDTICNIKKVAKKMGYSVDTVRKYVIIKKKKTKDEIKKQKVTSVINWRQRTKKKLVEYKGGKCEKCSYNKCMDAMEFHHTDPNEKDFSISGKSWSFDRLKKEVDKCILVCSNCHKEIHYLERNN